MYLCNQMMSGNMKIRIRLILAALVTVVVLSSCQPQKQIIKELDTLAGRIVSSSSKWNEADWDDALQYYEELYHACEDYEFSADQQRVIDSLQHVCNVQLMKHHWGQHQ